MRKLLLPVLGLGLAGPVCAQPPEAPPAAPTTASAHAPRGPIGAAMANLTRALRDAAEQARRPDAPASAPADAQPTVAPAARTREPRPQPTAQAALP